MQLAHARKRGIIAAVLLAISLLLATPAAAAPVSKSKPTAITIYPLLPKAQPTTGFKLVYWQRLSKNVVIEAYAHPAVAVLAMVVQNGRLTVRANSAYHCWTSWAYANADGVLGRTWRYWIHPAWCSDRGRMYSLSWPNVSFNLTLYGSIGQYVLLGYRSSVSKLTPYRWQAYNQGETAQCVAIKLGCFDKNYVTFRATIYPGSLRWSY